jgi:hypothetical protein
MGGRPSLRTLFGIGLVSGCTLAQQVLLTRMLSAVLFYHFMFLAISLALLGTAVGGLVVYLWPRAFSRDPPAELMARWALAFAVLLIVTPLVLVRLDYTYNNTITTGFVVSIGLACVVALLPFLAAGIVLTLAIRGYTSSLGHVYAFDLVGAGVGALASVPAMAIVSAPTGMVALGALAGIAAIMFAGPRVVSWRLSVVVTAAACGLTGLSAATPLNHLASPYFPGVTPRAEKWSPLNRVLGYAPRPGKDSSFGYLFYDRVYAPVPTYRRGEPYPDWRQLLTSSQSVGLTLAAGGRVLVVGGGGGRDIYDALSSGAKQVDVIELNQTIVDVVDKDLGYFSGAPYTLPAVHTTIGDGRAILAARSTKYDEIHIGFADTLSGSSANAFALSENNLYTLEAFQEYFDHLTPNGILNVTRQYHLVGDEALRATVLTLAALQHRGVAQPERNVVVILGQDQFGETPGTVLSQLHPYTADELALIRSLAAERGDTIAFAPGGPYVAEWAGLAHAANLQSFCSSYRLNVCAPTDDKPFFFSMTRLHDMFRSLPRQYVYTVSPYLLLGVTVLVLLLLTVLALLVPMVAVRGAAPVGSLWYFAAIGVGYLTFEIVLIQRLVLFLGFPTYALSVVLFSMLVFTGLGSFLSSRWQNPRRALLVSLTVGCGLIGLSAFLLQPVLRSLITLPFPARVLVTVLLIAPPSTALGAAMPIGLRRLSGLYRSGVPWAWAINGFASVLAAAVATFTAINWGFAATTVVALACYLIAVADAALRPWPSMASTDERPTAAVSTDRESTAAGVV